MTHDLGIERSHVVALCRLRHVLCALAHLYDPDRRALGTWSGSIREGDWMLHDREGNHVAVAWTPQNVVGLVYSEGSDRSQRRVPEHARRPLKHLDSIGAPFDTMARETAASVEDLVTAGLWGDGTGVVTSDPQGAHGLDLIAGFQLSPRMAAAQWAPELGLPKPHVSLAVRMLRGGTLDEDDEDVLLDLPDGVERIELEVASDVGAQLAEAGLRWNVSIKRIRMLNAHLVADRQARVRASLAPEAVALFEAVRSGDAARTQVLCVPAALNARTLEDQFADTPAGDTPLIQACKAGERDCALVLVRAGADVDLANDHEQSGLLWATRLGDTVLVEACIASSHQPGRADRAGHTPLHHLAAAGSASLVDLLLAAGADPTARDRVRTTPADWASRAGHDDLAERLRAAT